VVLVAVLGGFFALTCSFASVAFGPTLWWLLGELASSLVMVGAIAIGVAGRYHHHWILLRHRAERLRLLRFAWMVDPRHWDAPAEAGPALARDLQAEVDAIVACAEPEMKQWARDTRPPVVEIPDRVPSAAFVEAFKRYYVRQRLSSQLAYFVDMAERRERLDAVTRILPAATFGMALVLSFAHLIDELAGYWHGEALKPPRGWPLFLILVLPAAGAAARLLRSAFEFARNRQRFVVTAAELDRARGWLDMATNPADVARAMIKAEDALAQEHREWLRLMLEAEWYG
jgi:hypothetical protein